MSIIIIIIIIIRGQNLYNLTTSIPNIFWGNTTP